MTRLLVMFLFAGVLQGADKRDAFVFVHDGVSVTNGAAVDVKAIKAAHAAPFFWFTSGGSAYVVRDADTLRAVREVYEPLFAAGAEQAGWSGEQLALFQKQMQLSRDQMRIGLEPQAGDSEETRARRAGLKLEQNRLARRQNQLARRQNRAARTSPEKINREIEVELSMLARELVRNGGAQRVR